MERQATKEAPMTVGQVETMGRGGRRPHISVVRRWAGFRGWKVELADDENVMRADVWTLRLPSARIGRELVTLREWCDWFERTRLRLSTRIIPAIS